MVRTSEGAARRSLIVHRPGRLAWRAALELQRGLAARVLEERCVAHLVLVEHLRRRGIDVERCDRGGDVTWHGPGQVVGYPIVHLPTFHLRVAAFVHGLEEAMARACSKFGVEAAAGGDRIGTWTGGKKIGSVGIHVSRGVTTHGFALNACPELAHFALINPCGMPGCPMTTIELEAKKQVSWMAAADAMEAEIAAMLGV
ncbi:MAG: lipoyl(octanoyl) [Planctomycetota bacterium]|nr:MAG: lipoyl(octanoyl) [Planctomycetota bacterium]